MAFNASAESITKSTGILFMKGSLHDDARCMTRVSCNVRHRVNTQYMFLNTCDMFNRLNVS